MIIDDFLRVRCVATRAYRPSNWHGIAMVELIINNIYLVKSRIKFDDIETYYVYDQDRHTYYGVYPKDNFIPLDEWRENQLNILIG